VNVMKAVVQDGYGSADVLHLREIEMPVLSDDRVLVRVRAASVNALDWHTVHGGDWSARSSSCCGSLRPPFGVRMWPARWRPSAGT